MHLAVVLIMTLAPLLALGAEHRFDFSETDLNRTPSGFTSTVTGEGSPGRWEVILDNVPPKLAPLSPNAPAVTQRPVLAQLSEEMKAEHFPLLVYDEEEYKDFKFTTRFKLVKGVVEQMAGVVFRVQDSNNFYVVRASGFGNNFRFYKVVDGKRGNLIGPSVEIERDRWYEISVECQANQIRCLLDGKELFPMISDSTFSKGKVGFWTMSDSVSYFADARIEYTPLVPSAQRLVREAMGEYKRLLGLKIFARRSKEDTVRMIASDKEEELGAAGGGVEAEVINKGRIHILKDRGSVTVTMPLRDRNGEPVAVVRVIMESFPGQTDRNAIARVQPLIKAMDRRIQYRRDLFD